VKEGWKEGKLEKMKDGAKEGWSEATAVYAHHYN
jgi:hypothetical protein